MRVEETGLAGVLLFVPEVHEDDRGHFLETYRAERHAEAGLPLTFPQDNLSFSRAGVLRGLHLQWPRAQGKLIHVLEGEVFDVAVDLRRDSSGFRRWEGHTLSARNRRQIWIPPGFAHGFLVTGPQALLSYKCSEVYERDCELAVRWDDPDLGIEWPVAEPVLSPRDAAAPLLRDIPPERLPSV